MLRLIWLDKKFPTWKTPNWLLFQRSGDWSYILIIIIIKIMI